LGGLHLYTVDGEINDEGLEGYYHRRKKGHQSQGYYGKERSNPKQQIAAHKKRPCDRTPNRQKASLTKSKRSSKTRKQKTGIKEKKSPKRAENKKNRKPGISEVSIAKGKKSLPRPTVNEAGT